MNEFLQTFDKFLLDLTCEHLSLAVLFSDLFKSIIIFEEELKILERNINFQVGSISFMFFESGTTSREGIFINFGLDLIGLISE